VRKVKTSAYFIKIVYKLVCLIFALPNSFSVRWDNWHERRLCAALMMAIYVILERQMAMG